MANYPERPARRRIPKSTHSASKKSRTWMQTPGASDKPKIENHSLAFSRAGHSNPALLAFLAKHRNNRIPVGTRQKAGPRPFTV